MISKPNLFTGDRQTYIKTKDAIADPNGAIP
jgi:hypothetical protein